MTLKYFGTPNPLCVGEIASDKYTPDPLSPNSKLGYFTWIELNPNSRAFVPINSKSSCMFIFGYIVITVSVCIIYERTRSEPLNLISQRLLSLLLSRCDCREKTFAEHVIVEFKYFIVAFL